MTLPHEIEEKLERAQLRPLIYSLATEVESRRAGCAVADIVRALMPGTALGPRRRAEMYQGLRDRVRARVDQMDDLQYVQGLS